ncbi:YdcP family protein [Bacillus sonorensis]|uniref:YdcP family protein n=1 Tax=Bacillus sonorensis TaxID=119858 RepID=UPI00227F3992|nr:YdcP family protein [Bacillus sonorensis]MCY8272960.1 YdcP family protein [Bacillus sonorensis]MCY8605229.1 YdcP family protein [Bacillus sonorensis]
MNLNFIVPDINKTFGEMKFMGLNKERYVYDRENNKRTDVLESRVYNIASAVQGGQIEVTIPEYAGAKEIPAFADIELKNPKISAMATTQRESTFANVNWKLEAEDIVVKGASASKPATTTSGNDKK